VSKAKLTEMQKKFCDEYIRRGRKEQGECARVAGFSDKSADPQSSQMLKKPHIIEYLEEREKEMTDVLKSHFLYEAIKAKDVMARILNDPEASDKDVISVCKDFLDRAGFKPTDKVELDITKMPSIEIIKPKK